VRPRTDLSPLRGARKESTLLGPSLEPSVAASFVGRDCVVCLQLLLGLVGVAEGVSPLSFNLGVSHSEFSADMSYSQIV